MLNVHYCTWLYHLMYIHWLVYLANGLFQLYFNSAAVWADAMVDENKRTNCCLEMAQCFLDNTKSWSTLIHVKIRLFATLYVPDISPQFTTPGCAFDGLSTKPFSWGFVASQFRIVDVVWEALQYTRSIRAIALRRVDWGDLVQHLAKCSTAMQHWSAHCLFTGWISHSCTTTDFWTIPLNWYKLHWNLPCAPFSSEHYQHTTSACFSGLHTLVQFSKKSDKTLKWTFLIKS